MPATPTQEFLAGLIDTVRTAARLEESVTVTADSSFVEDLGIDSLDLVGVLVEIQDRFGVDIPEEVVPDLLTVGDVAGYVQEHRVAA